MCFFVAGEHGVRSQLFLEWVRCVVVSCSRVQVVKMFRFIRLHKVKRCYGHSHILLFNLSSVNPSKKRKLCQPKLTLTHERNGQTRNVGKTTKLSSLELKHWTNVGVSDLESFLGMTAFNGDSCFISCLSQSNENMKNLRASHKNLVLPSMLLCYIVISWSIQIQSLFPVKRR